MKSSLLFAACGLLTLSLLTLSGCAGGKKSSDGADAASIESDTIRLEAQARAEEARVQELNRQIAMANPGMISELSSHDYRLGPGDVIKIEAPQAPEINGLSVRITGPGTVTIPLLGDLQLGGLSTAEAEDLMAQRLGKYVHTPQVSLFIQDYASQEITVTGAVAKPGVYPIQRPRTLVEVLSMVGGLTGDAGSNISVNTTAPDPSTGQPAPHRLLIDLDELVKNQNAQALVLGGGDSVYVPEAGVFFVEGAIAKPGSYPLRPGTTVLKAVTVAGGPKWEAVEANVRIIRHDDGGIPRELNVDLASVKNEGAPDTLLEDGDVVIVDTNDVKKGAVVMWDQTLRVLSLGVLYR
jgi:polysaccharide export outer membrane protein